MLRVTRNIRRCSPPPFSKFLPRFFEFLQLFRLQRTDDVEPRLVLEFLKVHLLTP
jgi:hypothetical protein